MALTGPGAGERPLPSSLRLWPCEEVGAAAPPHGLPGIAGPVWTRRHGCPQASREAQAARSCCSAWEAPPPRRRCGRHRCIGPGVAAAVPVTREPWRGLRRGLMGPTSPHGPCSPPSSKPQRPTSRQPSGDVQSPLGVASERPDSTVPPPAGHLAWIVQPGAPNRNSSRTKDVTTPRVCPVLCLKEEIGW